MWNAILKQRKDLNVHFLMTFFFPKNYLLLTYTLSDRVIHGQCSGAAGKAVDAQLQLLDSVLSSGYCLHRDSVYVLAMFAWLSLVKVYVHSVLP